MTPPTLRTRRAWRRYFEALARSERALRRAERALGAVALAADRCPGDPDAVALRHVSVTAALAVGRLRRRLAAVGNDRREGTS